ncbi:MAG: aldolase/citrate lyase family protein [Candidatus Solibacter sp.]
MKEAPFSLVYFCTEPQRIAEAVTAGIDTIMVDCERLGKEARQAGADTQINGDTLDDLRRVRGYTRANVACRINRYHTFTEMEVEDAIEAGADEIFLPMVRAPREVERVLQAVAGRCRLSILVETREAVECAPQLACLPVARVYMGLNDLAIDRGAASIFDAVADGTVEQVRREFTVPFGFGGLTLPELGAPLPCRLLMAEMARLDCSFSFLRRSFTRDTEGRSLSRLVPRIRGALRQASLRTPAAVECGREEFRLSGASWPKVEGVIA